MICSKTQPLDKFAKVILLKKKKISAPSDVIFTCTKKSQRRNAEKARCIKCIKKREEEDVWASDPDSDSDDEYGQFM